MSRLNEPLAKKSNLEDYVSGRFWESRYTSIALLDETAVLSCMAYVDLNPIRAGIVEELQQSFYTSINKRLNELTIQPSSLTQPIKSISGGVNGRAIKINLNDYVALVEWAGKNIAHPNKAIMPTHINTLLINLNLQPNNWLTQMKNLGKGSPHAIGSVEKLKQKAKMLSKKWIKGIKANQLLYLKA